MKDRALSDALWLLAHPGWTWHALQETPAEVVDLIGRAEAIRSDVEQKRAGR